MERCKSWLAVLALAVMIGCEEPPPPPKPAPPPPPSAERAKAVLREIAATGIVNSGIATFMDYVAYVRKSDPDQADALSEDLSEMMKASGRHDTDALKAKAQEIAEKL